MSIQDPETVSAIAARLMRGHDVRLARIGVLRSSWTPSQKDGARLLPPRVEIVLDSKPNLAEPETPGSVDFLSRRIREGLSKGERVGVDGLGQFDQDETELIFHPDERLKTAVNAALSHLEPHSLPEKPEFAAPPPPPPPPPQAPPPPDPPTEPDPRSEPVVEDEPESEPAWMSLESKTAATLPQPPTERSRSADRTPRSRSRPGREKNPMRIPAWLLIAGALIPVLVVALGVLLWPDDSQPVMDPPPDTTQEFATASPGTDQPSSDSSATGSTVPPARPDSTPGTQTEQDAQAEQPAQPAPSGASTGQLTRGLPGYTLILASGVSEASAIALAQTLQDLDLPYGVLTYAVEGGTLNRLALGQWPTVAEADSMRTVLADRLPDGTWVKRLD